MVGLVFLGASGAILLITWIIQKRRGETSDFYGRGNPIDAQRAKYDLLAKDYTRRK